MVRISLYFRTEKEMSSADEYAHVRSLVIPLIEELEAKLGNTDIEFWDADASSNNALIYEAQDRAEALKHGIGGIRGDE